KDHPGGPGLRDARDEVISRSRREAQVALEAAPEFGEPVVREAPAGLDERSYDLVRLLTQAVAGEALRDQRVVVRPHRAVVVAHRVVGWVLARKGADAPAGVHVRLHQPARDARRATRRRDAAPERMPGVARDRGDLPLVPVKRLRVARLRLHPEIALEALVELPGFATKAIGAHDIAVDGVEVGDPGLGGVDVRLHLDERRGQLGPLAV